MYQFGSWSLQLFSSQSYDMFKRHTSNDAYECFFVVVMDLIQFPSPDRIIIYGGDTNVSSNNNCWQNHLLIFREYILVMFGDWFALLILFFESVHFLLQSINFLAKRYLEHENILFTIPSDDTFNTNAIWAIPAFPSKMLPFHYIQWAFSLSSSTGIVSHAISDGRWLVHLLRRTTHNL